VFEDLDELARGLAENDISRRQAIKWAGYSVAGAALSSMGFAETAEALTRRQRRRCRRKGGTPLERGECHCGFKCGSSADIVCESNRNCSCTKTIEGRGFCANFNVNCPNVSCTSSSKCPSGTKCVVNTCCEPSAVCLPACSSSSSMSAPRGSGMTPGGPRGG
jgi:hypothetical protein